MTEKKMQPLQLDGIQPGERVAVAMSGGVDSSVAACLVQEAGYEVVGITLQLYDQGAALKKKGACCAGQDIYDARQVADKMGFPHYVLDYESVFKQAVIDDFVDTYLAGSTPIPCIRCNQKVKFKDLLSMAKDLGAKALVTGHYIERRMVNNKPQLHMAVDDNRDQSYFLFTTTEEQLDYLRFPLGTMPKSETREHANRFGLKIADKPDSQDICFVPNGSYASVVSKIKPGALDPGHIVHLDGRVLGEHQGIINYTIGQRRGLGVAATNPLYVVRLDAEKKIVYVGSKEDLAVQTITLKEANLLSEIPKPSLNCKVKVRSTTKPIAASLHYDTMGILKVNFMEPQFGIASGQACVFYNGTQMLGGGWITDNHLQTKEAI